MPILKARFMENQIEGERLDEESTRVSEDSDWKERLKCYTDCEYVTKVDEIINDHANWNRLVSDDWEFAFKISLKMMQIGISFLLLQIN